MPAQSYDPQVEIQKYIPRQPQRLNEVSYRFGIGERKNSNLSHGMEKRKIGPIDLSVLDSRKGPSPQRNAPPAMSGTMTNKTTGGMFKSFGFGNSGEESKAQT